MFFESKHSLDENLFRLSVGMGMNFPLHIHRSFEYYAQISGQTRVEIDGKDYLLTPGKAVLIFPFQVHSYCADTPDEQHRMCIFSPDMVPDFYKQNGSGIPEDNLFEHALSEMPIGDNVFTQRSVAYGICGAFHVGRSYRDAVKGIGDGTLTELLIFADRSFRSECLLRDAAAFIGYDYAYVSKLFKRRIGIPFKQYVNLLRIRESRLLLRSTNDSISSIKEKCGFQTLRSFDREFMRETGMTPSEYRASHKADRRE
ncbi:MAG: AraC family transcriptional regulator [Clostridia bacterium]|nr:AraC family transcriptional regulator [Clostridia bacterium]